MGCAFCMLEWFILVSLVQYFKRVKWHVRHLLCPFSIYVSLVFSQKYSVLHSGIPPSLQGLNINCISMLTREEKSFLNGRKFDKLSSRLILLSYINKIMGVNLRGMLVNGCMNNQHGIKKDLALNLSIAQRCLAAFFPIEQFNCISELFK